MVGLWLIPRGKATKALRFVLIGHNFADTALIEPVGGHI